MSRRLSLLPLLLALLTSACATSTHAASRAVPFVVARVVGHRHRSHQPARPWRITDVGTPHEIEGFANRTSVLAGKPVTLYVSTTAPSYRVSAFRMGWYGGAEGRLVWRSGVLAGHRQTGAGVVIATNTVRADWRPSLVLSTRGFAPGDYLLRLDASTGAQRFVPLTLRGGSALGRVVLVNAVTTWQAYNEWGGFTLYHGHAGRSDFAHRARAVSFDRPYAGLGDGQFTGRELPVVALAEKLGLPLEYVTDIDLHEHPDLLRGARAVITMGHDEYWSLPMREAVTRARDAGTNVAFLGANAVYRRIRLEPSPLGPDRVEVNYKVAKEDPLAATGSAETTSNWDAPPKPMPPSTLTGVTYDCSKARADMVVVDPGNWLFAGTGAHVGTRWKDVVGTEADRALPHGPRPANLEVLTYSPYDCAGRRPTWSDATYYTVPSGAGVFSSGTITWDCVLGATCSEYGGGDAQEALTRVTTTLLEVFAAGPAGRQHPSVPNARAVLG